MAVSWVPISVTRDFHPAVTKGIALAEIVTSQLAEQRPELEEVADPPSQLTRDAQPIPLTDRGFAGGSSSLK